jgi:hypothetical protein
MFADFITIITTTLIRPDKCLAAGPSGIGFFCAVRNQVREANNIFHKSRHVQDTHTGICDYRYNLRSFYDGIYRATQPFEKNWIENIRATRKFDDFEANRWIERFGPSVAAAQILPFDQL